MKERFFDQNLLNEIIDQAHNPPGGDKVMGNFYMAVVWMIDGQEELARLLEQVKRGRPEITDKHLVNLLFRSCQYLKLQNHDLSHRNYQDPKLWQEELHKIMSDSNQSSLLEACLLTKSTTTTIYQRYAGPYAIMAHLFDGQAITVADLGCGGNYGLRGIDVGELFQSVEDKTPSQTFSQLLSRPINIEEGWAIDKEDPDANETKIWRLSCSLYPQELGLLPKIEEFEERIKGSRRIQFLQADLLRYDGLRPVVSDVVILSTVLYQLHRAEQMKFLKQAKQFLKPGGIIIVQDFAQKDPTNPTHLDFSESWFGREFTYRTFITQEQRDWKFAELLQWSNGRCEIVRAGLDFKDVFNPYLESSAKTALAHSTS